MATYAIGDVQGCLATLDQLLEVTGFDPRRDRLWFTGDLVNRGPDSLGVLRRVRALADVSTVVLGNHDLHLLALRHCRGLASRRGDTLDAVMRAPDRDVLLDWLRQQPLFHHDRELGFSLVHAGLPREWSIGDALERAAEVEAALRGPELSDFLAGMYGDRPDRWSERLAGPGRLRFITNCFTRIRYCHTDGSLDLRTKEGHGTAPSHLIPWFALRGRLSEGARIVFGHWSTLRLTPAEMRSHTVLPLDTGAVWGGALSALRLEDGARYSVPGPPRR